MEWTFIIYLYLMISIWVGLMQLYMIPTGGSSFVNNTKKVILWSIFWPVLFPLWLFCDGDLMKW